MVSEKKKKIQNEAFKPFKKKEKKDSYFKKDFISITMNLANISH